MYDLPIAIYKTDVFLENSYASCCAQTIIHEALESNNIEINFDLNDIDVSDIHDAYSKLLDKCILDNYQDEIKKTFAKDLIRRNHVKSLTERYKKLVFESLE